jgi:hypothetical protein
MGGCDPFWAVADGIRAADRRVIELADDLKTRRLGEAGDRLALGVEAKAGLALLLGRDAKICA